MFMRQEMQKGVLVDVPSQVPCPIELRVEVRRGRASLPVAVRYKVLERVDSGRNHIRVGAGVVFDVEIRNRGEPTAYSVFQIMGERVLGFAKAVLFPVPRRIKNQAWLAPLDIAIRKVVGERMRSGLLHVRVLLQIPLWIEVGVRAPAFPGCKIKKMLQGGGAGLRNVRILGKIELGVEQPALGDEIEFVRSLPSGNVLGPPVVAIAAGAVACSAGY